MSRSTKENSSYRIVDAAVSFFQRLNPRAMLRYAVVGVAQNAACYVVFLFLIWHGWTAWQASAAFTPLAIAVTFIANRSWTFSQQSRQDGQFQRYIIVYAFAYVFTVGFSWLQEFIGVPSWLAALFSIIVTAGGIYLALNFWVFHSHTPASQRAS
ncbi:GtrA family protein [Hyphomicrobium sp.]|uniref:GtrA family protein n=1 Tax=Hyphomicrobium sp. TaxID=82 RepID=UPI002E33008D|nr:GtrA family protein [Hyphomicrobium sp.]HEX2841188.1 GtrA family protein [Hyphomicrobium sp.]